jgi:propanediol utilization protein
MYLNDGDYVDVMLDGERGISFANIMIRVKEGYVTEMHIDTDEANAAGIAFRTKGEMAIDEPCGQADIVSRKNMDLNVRTSV